MSVAGMISFENTLNDVDASWVATVLWLVFTTGDSLVSAGLASDGFEVCDDDVARGVYSGGASFGVSSIALSF